LWERKGFEIMIFEERIYNIPPVSRVEHTKYLGEQAVPTMVKHGAEFIGMWETVFGQLNEVIVLLRWEDLAHREAGWMKIATDPDFKPSFCEADSGICITCLARSLKVNILKPTEYSASK
jgi:hypothetical protein